jgi:hypothetical protein
MFELKNVDKASTAAVISFPASVLADIGFQRRASGAARNPLRWQRLFSRQTFRETSPTILAGK